ncbi:MAG TPA: hypothetical protein VFK13_04185 [Gemmatimonadaceae bacterium]|nr:hypothetical protein [Gemmatimonadaceae bacterium]
MPNPIRLLLVPIIAGAALCVASARPLAAQGNSHHGAEAHAVPPGHAKKVVTVDQAVVVTREVLVKHGYEVVRVEEKKGVKIVYYRRGNMGNGRGKGPVERMVIRPSTETVLFEDAPPKVLVDVRVRLSL